jgi:TRAP transporter TAXI family solute receptor
VAAARPNSGSAAGRLRAAALAIAALLVMAAMAGAAWMALKPAAIVAVRIAAGPSGSDAHDLLAEVAQVAVRHGKPVRPDLVSTVDPSESIARLNAGEVDLAVIRADTPVGSDVNIVAGLFPDYFLLIARRDAGVFLFPDLAGKRVVLPPAGSEAYRSFFSIIDHYDMGSAPMDLRSQPLAEARRALLNGTADALFTVRSLRDPQLMRLFDDAELKDMAIDIVPVPQAAAIAMKRPLLAAQSIPQGALSGAIPTPAGNVTTVSVGRILVARADAEPAAIRALTEVMFENRLDLTLRMPLAAMISRPDAGSGLSIPLHEGAAAYFNRDEPSFLEANSNSIGLLLTVAAMVGSGLLALRSWFLARQKNKADVFNFRLTELNARALAATTGAELDEIRRELAAMLTDVVAALDADEVTDDGFHAFSRILDTVSGTVRDRETALRQTA